MGHAVSDKLEQDQADRRTHEVDMLESTHHTRCLHADWKMCGCTSWKKKRKPSRYELSPSRCKPFAHRALSRTFARATRYRRQKSAPKSSIDFPTGSLLPSGVCDMLYSQMAVPPPPYSRCAMFCRLLFRPRYSVDYRSRTRDVLPPAFVVCVAPLPAYSRYAMIFRRLISGARCYSAGLPCLHRYASIFFAIASRS